MRRALSAALLLGAACSSPKTKAPPPIAPINLTAGATDATMVVLHWENRDVGAELVVIRRDGVPIAELVGSLNQFSDNGVTPNTQFSYTVSAKMRGIESAQAGPAAVVTLPTRPILAASGVSTLEDTPFHLSFVPGGATDPPPETVSLVIDHIPTGFTPSGPTTMPADALSSFTLTPAANVSGSFWVSGTAIRTGRTNATASSMPVQLPITVTPVADAPVLVVTEASGDEGTAIPLAITAMLTDTDGSESLVLAIANVPVGATLSKGAFVGNGTWIIQPTNLSGLTITPPPGSDTSFTLEVSATTTERFNGDTATVTMPLVVTIIPVDDPPVAVEDALSTPEDTPLVVQATALLANDTDPDGPTLTVAAVSNATHGTVQLSGGAITFTPDAEFNGDAGFDYTLSDGTLTSSTHVTVTVTPVNDPPAAVADALTTDEDTELEIDTDTLLANDTDVDSTIAFAGTSNVTGGTLSTAGTTFTFTPTPDSNGTAGFDYSITDGEFTASAHVTITVVPVNDAPVAVDDTGNVVKDTPLTIPTATLLANDSDVDGPMLNVVSVSDAVNGQVTLTGNQITFTPAAGFIGTASFQYTVSDGALTATATDVLSVVTCILGTDSDGDRLDDCYESNTGVYVSATDTGTNPRAADTDGDGLRDGDELLGTIDGLDLPGLGANPLHKDIFLEYDWFDDNAEPGFCAPHTHRPSTAELDKVTAAFAAGPITNPDGVSGITLHHDYGQGGLFNGGGLVPDSDGVLTSGIGSGEYLSIKAANFANNRRGYFHYVLMPHAYYTNSTSTGQAELSGNDMIVSLGCLPLDGLANSVMHELGHNLSLRHGGDTDCNQKPNYNSVMNYLFTFPGVDRTCDAIGDGAIDYSRGTNVTLLESALNENVGVCGAIPIDWNGDSTLSSALSLDINGNGYPLNTSPYPTQTSECGGVLTSLSDYNDWGHITLAPVTQRAARVPHPVIDCTLPRRTAQ